MSVHVYLDTYECARVYVCVYNTRPAREAEVLFIRSEEASLQ